MFCAFLGQDIRFAFTGPMVLWFVFVTYLENKYDNKLQNI